MKESLRDYYIGFLATGLLIVNCPIVPLSIAVRRPFMKRRAVLVVFVLSIVSFTFAGCAGDAESTPMFGQNDLAVSLYGTVFYLNMDILNVIPVLGEDFEYYESISCEHDGFDKSFIYANIHFYTYPLPHGDMVFEIFTNHPGALTSRGIGIGATVDEVLTAHGSGGVVSAHEIVYSLPPSSDFPVGAALCFDLRDGVVVAFYATARAW